MEIDKGDIKDDLQVMQGQTDGMGFVGTNENDTWRRELTADDVVKKLTINNVCYIDGCKNIRNIDKCLCDEHLFFQTIANVCLSI